MKNIKLEKSIFENLTIGFTIFVSAFIFAALACIVCKGFPYLPEVFHSEEVRFAVALSIQTSIISTIICLILGIPTAYALTKTKLKFRNFYSIIIELPLSIPNMMLGLSLLLMFSSKPGKFLASKGINFIFDVKGIILAHILVNLPLVIRIIKTTFINVDERLEVVAKSLGASNFRTFFHITFPLSRNAIIGAGIIAWSRALGEFGATLMFVGATRMKTETIPTSIFLNMATGDIGSAMASAMILLIISAFSLIISNLFNCSAEENSN